MESVLPLLSEPVLGCNFADPTGSMAFGFVDTKLFEGELSVVPVNNHTDGSWTVTAISFAIDGKDVGATQNVLFGMSSCPYSVFQPRAHNT